MSDLQASFTSPASPSLDARRIVRRTVIGSVIVVGLLTALRQLGNGGYGADFLVGLWPAGWHVLHGGSPYPAADVHLLVLTNSSFVTPPVLADMAAPFALLPRHVALVLWNTMNVAALATALWFLGVRRPVIFLLAITSAGMLEGLAWGQPDALFALAAALAWRYRDSPGSAIALGWVIAAKLFVVPLLLWLALTRRFRLLAIATAATVGWLALSWASIGFAGLSNYPHLLSADAAAFERTSVSVAGGLMLMGASAHVALATACVVALVSSVGIIWLSRRSDAGIFAACLAAGLIATPIAWIHYLVLMVVPIATTRSQRVWMWVVSSEFMALLLRVLIPGAGTLKWATVVYVLGVSAACVSRRELPPVRELVRLPSKSTAPSRA